jgi:hypothetical protein
VSPILLQNKHATEMARVMVEVEDPITEFLVPKKM